MSTAEELDRAVALVRPKKLQHAKPALKLQVSAAKRQSATAKSSRSSSRNSSRSVPTSSATREIKPSPGPVAPRTLGGSPPRQKGRKPAGFAKLVPPAYAERELRPDPSRTDPSLTSDREMPCSPPRRSPQSQRRVVKPPPLGVPQLLPPTPPGMPLGDALADAPAELGSTQTEAAAPGSVDALAGAVDALVDTSFGFDAEPAEPAVTAIAANVAAEDVAEAANAAAEDVEEAAANEAAIEAAAAAAAVQEQARPLRPASSLLALREEQLEKQSAILSTLKEIVDIVF